MTKFAVSNIAWPAEQRDDAYRILAEAGIGGLEIAPGLFLPHAEDPFRPSRVEKDAALAPMRDAGLTLVSMQSLLFGVQGAALFGTEAERATFEAAMLRAIDLAGELAIPKMVFGSPRQRAIPDGLDPSAAETRAVEVFRKLGDAAQSAGTRIALEPNAPDYGTNFLNRVEETAAFVRRVDHPAVALNFDVGALHAQGDFERIETIAPSVSDCTAHVHISEPALAPAPRDPEQAARVLTAMQRAGYNGWYSIEMAATADCIQDLTSAIARLRAAEAAAAGRTITDD